MNHCTTRSSINPVRWLALVILSCTALPSLADIVHTIDLGQLSGNASLESGSDTLTLTDRAGQAKQLKLIDLDEVRFNVDPKPAKRSALLLIDNESEFGGQQKQAKIKLRKGLHRITVPYWQKDGTSHLFVYVSGPGINRRVELGAKHLRWFRHKNAKVEPSAGMDAQGYRLPEFAHEVASNQQWMLIHTNYRLYTTDKKVFPTSVRHIASMQLKRSGTTSAINTAVLGRQKHNVAVVFDAFFKADQDGEYQFTLVSDDGSQLYFGQVDDFVSKSLSEPNIHDPWQADLAHHGRALGQLKSIADETLTFHVPLISDMTISLSHTRALWLKIVDPDKLNRENEPDNEDTVYLHDKNDPTIIRSVSGKIIGLDEQSLTFAFRGKERTITRGRIIGMVFKHASRPVPESPGIHQVIEVQGGQRLPAKIRSMTDHVAFDVIGGGLLTPPRAVVSAMRIENGRRIDLTRTMPNAEEAIPYFGLKLPYKVNTNFSGKPIVLFDEQTYERGLAVHSKSRLHYKLKPNAQRFQATFGLMAPGGKLGNVQARVLGDGKTLWAQDDITPATKPIRVDVDLKGIQRLILEVDFGKGQDVGDRAAWVDPRLIYASPEGGQP